MHSLVKGLQDFEPFTLKSYMGRAYQSFAPLIMGPALEGSDLRYMVIIGNKPRKPELIYNDIVTKSPLAAMFAHARVVKKIACMATAYSSMKIPCRGNILVIGDALPTLRLKRKDTHLRLSCWQRCVPGTLRYGRLCGIYQMVAGVF